MAQNVQRSTMGAADTFNRFVEGTGAEQHEPERKDFWDSFGGASDGFAIPAAGSASKPSAIGTAAMKKTSASDGGAASTAAGKDEWSDDF